MRVVFVGTGAIGVPALRALLKSGHEVVAVVTQPDKPVGRNQRVEAPPIKQALSGLAIPVLQPARIKQETSVEQIRGFDPDVLVVMAYGQILPGSLLAVPKRVCINLHASLLPKWRGAAPIQAAIAAGDKQTGLTVMYVDEGLDTGDILLQDPIEISTGDTGGTIHDRLAQIAPDGMLRALDWIKLGKAPRIPQDSSQATYAPKLDRESGRIKWTEPAEIIERKIRAFDPWPGSFTELSSESGGRRKLKVFSATITTDAGKSGEILRRDKELVIAGRTQALSLTEVQLEGRKRMSAADFIRGNQWIETAETA
jgi:methionyl-tRNA formyltransferase